MNTEELFKLGVTLKKGDLAGKRFAVNAIRPDGLDVYSWGTPNSTLAFFKHGEYDIWRPPKTIFDNAAPVTLGQLKDAAAQNELPEGTRFYVVDAFGGIQDAFAKLGRINGEKSVIIY